jgi:hypothetical protein
LAEHKNSKQIRKYAFQIEKIKTAEKPKQQQCEQIHII